MTRDDLFNTNASIVSGLAEACAENCPDACFGITTLDVVRAEAFIAESQGWNVLDVSVPVVGGHAGTTILPLLSQTKNSKGLTPKWTQEEIGALTHRIQFGGDEVVKAKDGAGSATLSMAMAAARFSDSLLRAFDGEKDIVECCYVESDVTENTFFSSPVSLSKDGVEEIFNMGEISEFEKQGFDSMIGDLGKQIQKGVDFVNKA